MNVSIDEDFARFGGKSYAINKINSVEVRTRRPHGTGGAVAAAIIGAFAIIGGVAQAAEPQGISFTSIFIGTVFLGIAYWQWQRSKIRDYLLFLMTSSSETQAFITRSQDEVFDLREQIEQAMLYHSRGSVNRRD